MGRGLTATGTGLTGRSRDSGPRTQMTAVISAVVIMFLVDTADGEDMFRFLWKLSLEMYCPDDSGSDSRKVNLDLE